MYDTLLYVNHSGAYARFVAVPYIAELGLNPDTTLILTALLNPLKLKHPRGLKLAEYPLVGPAQFSLNPEHDWRPVPLQSLLDGEEQVLDWSLTEVESVIRDAKRILYLAEPYCTVIYTFDQLLELCPSSEGRTVEYYCLNSLYGPELLEALKNENREELQKWAHVGEVRRYFEWNWNTNAQVILTPLLRKVGACLERTTLSKYGMQALYFIRDSAGREPVREYQLLRNFSIWPGTGKYEEQSLGSPRSYVAILRQLIDLGLVNLIGNEEDRAREVRLTRCGIDLMAELHPGCKDLDLPARLQTWAEEGLVKSAPTIDRYIKTVFGRQLQFQPAK